MEKEQQIYELQGVEEYIKYQVEHEAQPFSPGPAFCFIKVRGGGANMAVAFCVRSCLWGRSVNNKR